MRKINSEISGFYKLTIEERQKILNNLFDLNQDERKLLQNFGYFNPTQMDTLIENVVGSYQLPMGIACNFKINTYIPSATEVWHFVLKVLRGME